MPRLNQWRRVGACFLPVIVMAGLTACDPAVSDIDLSSLRSRGESAQGKLSKLEAELKELNSEVKSLTGYTGPEHEARMKKAEELRQELEELKSIKAEVDAKVERFTAEAKIHREAFAKELP